jgi:hypothetical protein
MLSSFKLSEVGQKWDVEILAQCKDFKSNKLQRVILGHLLKERMTSLEMGPSFLCGALASFDNSRSGSMASGEVCAHEVSNSLKGTKKKI